MLDEFLFATLKRAHINAADVIIRGIHKLPCPVKKMFAIRKKEGPAVGSLSFHKLCSCKGRCSSPIGVDTPQSAACVGRIHDQPWLPQVPPRPLEAFANT